MEVKEKYQTVMPYLILDGVDGFIDFAKKVFGAEELAVYRNDDGSVMHAEIKIGDSTIMIGESGAQWAVQNAGLYINVTNADASCKKALENGAVTIMDLEDKDYGRTCGVRDPKGNTWWITSPLLK